MSTEGDLESILRDAIQAEIEAQALYAGAVSLVKTDSIKATLRDLANEETGHRATLERMLTSPAARGRRVRQLQTTTVQDYKIGDRLVVRPLGPDSTFQDVCIFASRKEQQSFELYSGLAEQSEGEARDLFQAMSREELRHKNLVEDWYEQVVYKEF